MKIACKKYYSRIYQGKGISKDRFIGYEVKELGRWMKKNGLWDKWSKWYVGQTGGIIDGKFIVYHWDAERFLAGKPDLD